MTICRTCGWSVFSCNSLLKYHGTIFASIAHPFGVHKIFLSLFPGKKFQNVAKEGLKFGDEGEDQKEQLEKLEEEYEPLTRWLQETALSGQVCTFVLHRNIHVH